MLNHTFPNIFEGEFGEGEGVKYRSSFACVPHILEVKNQQFNPRFRMLKK